MSNQSKACDITPKVRATVLRRDSARCIYCHTPYALQLAHVWFNRSHSGLGVAENLVTLCIEHHMNMDNSRLEKSKPVRDVCETYLRSQYYGFDFSSLKYKKGE